MTARNDSLKAENILAFKPKTIKFEFENHSELFRLGETFYQDITSGVNSFGFSSIGYEMSQKRTVVGLACYFKTKGLKNIAIIADDLGVGLYPELIKHSHPEQISCSIKQYQIDVKRIHGHSDLIHLAPLLQTKEIETIKELKGLLSCYDLVLWDIPPWHKIQTSPEVYMNMIHHIQSLSLVVTPSLSSQEEVKRVHQFFSDYGVNLKGFILDSYKKKKKDLDLEKSA